MANNNDSTKDSISLFSLFNYLFIAMFSASEWMCLSVLGVRGREGVS